MPGDKPDRFAKATNSGAHRVILDLEDAVSVDNKSFARDAVEKWLECQTEESFLVRINAVDTPWHADDLSMLRRFANVGLVLPKAEVGGASQVLSRLSRERESVMLIETVGGLLGLRATASLDGVTRLAFGSIDFGLDAGMADGDDEPGMTAVRVQIALESRHAALLPPIDGVTPDFESGAAVARQAGRAVKLGFGGKLCIHPRQIGSVNDAFAPTEQECDWAKRVLKTFDASGGSAVAIDGRMVDVPVVSRARRIMAESLSTEAGQGRRDDSLRLE